MATRADKITQLSKKQEFFSDFLTNFDKHPITNNLAKTTNEESVKQSLRNLILTNIGERLFEPTVGSNVLASLFEPDDVVTAQNIVYHINLTVAQNEPRVNMLDVSVVPLPDQNAFSVSLLFSIINNPTPIALSLILRRVR
jgi:phage baseplate assembly protein W